MSIQRKKLLLLVGLASVSALAGCAGYEVNNGRGSVIGYLIPAELQNADRAVEAARQAGKDRSCPAEFRDAAATRDKAYDVYRACHTEEALALARQALAKTNALCPPEPPKPVVKAPEPAPAPPPPPAPVPVPPPAPTDQLSIAPGSVLKGEAATLSWSSRNASRCEIDNGVGAVPTQGSMTLTPTDSATYTLTCSGEGGVAKSAAAVAVTMPPPPPAPAPKLCSPTVIDIQFDTNKSDIKAKYHDELKKLADFLKEWPKAHGVIEGHTDSVGDLKSNMKLSQRRAESVRNYLIKNFGIAPERLEAKGYGPTKPKATNKTAEGKALNRRIEANFTCE